MKTKLTIELVPSTAWGSNVRTRCSQKDWNILRKESYQKASHKCEICGGVGTRYPVECHEIWHYDDKTKVQKLQGLISLCPPCHSVKHIGRTSCLSAEGVKNKEGKDYFDIAKEKLAQVNNWKLAKVDDYIKSSFAVWSERSSHKWEQDLSWLDNKAIKYNPIDISVKGKE